MRRGFFRYLQRQQSRNAGTSCVCSTVQHWLPTPGRACGRLPQHVLRRAYSTSEDQPKRRKRGRTCRVYSATGARIPYEHAWLCQQRLLHERLAWQREAPKPVEGHDALLLLEHHSVYTLGRGSTLDNLKFDPSEPGCVHEVRRTERGGEVTWHGPGQIVGYPVLDLNFHKKDLHWYLRQLEEVIIRVLARYQLEGERETEHTGVWVQGGKVAAIGLNATRWVTSHGFSLNVDADLAAFDAIVPCGIQGRPVTSLKKLLPPERLRFGGRTPLEAARFLVMEEFKNVFGLSTEAEDVDASTTSLEEHLFVSEGEPKLLQRLHADSLRQLELAR